MNGNRSKLKNARLALGAGIFVAAVALPGLFLVFPALGVEREGWADTRITIELIDKSVRESLATIAELIGIQIEVIGLSGDERRISVIFRNATLQKSLDRILAPADYVVIHSSEGTLLVLVIERNTADEYDPARERTRELSDPSPNQLSAPEDLFPPDDLEDLFPPDYLGEHDLTVLDRKNYGSDVRDLDLNDPELLPPSRSESTDFILEDTEYPPDLPDSPADIQ